MTATIARLVAEGKLETRVDGEKELHMKLKVDRDTLGVHERALVDGLFFGGRKETSTTDVRSHYKSKGFNPTSLIQPRAGSAGEGAGRPHRAEQVVAALAADADRLRLGRVCALGGRPGDGRRPRSRASSASVIPVLRCCPASASAIAAAWRGRIDRGLAGRRSGS